MAERRKSPPLFAAVASAAAALILTFLCATAAAALPAIDAPVVDEARVLSAQQIESLSAKLYAHYDTTGVQMLVVFVPTTGQTPIEDYSMALAREWGGGSLGRDDGLVLLFAVSDRLFRLEVGYGLEILLPDHLSARILAAARPLLREEEFGAAAEQVVDAVIARTAHLEPGGPVAHAGNLPLHRLARPEHSFPLLFWAALLLGFFWRRLRPQYKDNYDFLEKLSAEELEQYRNELEEDLSKVSPGDWLATGLFIAVWLAVGVLFSRPEYFIPYLWIVAVVLWPVYMLFGFHYGNNKGAPRRAVVVSLLVLHFFFVGLPYAYGTYFSIPLLFTDTSTAGVAIEYFFLLCMVPMVFFWGIYFALQPVGVVGREKEYRRFGYSSHAELYHHRPSMRPARTSSSSSGASSGGRGYSGGGGRFGGGGATSSW